MARLQSKNCRSFSNTSSFFVAEDAATENPRNPLTLVKRLPATKSQSRCPVLVPSANVLSVLATISGFFVMKACRILGSASIWLIRAGSSASFNKSASKAAASLNCAALPNCNASDAFLQHSPISAWRSDGAATVDASLQHSSISA